MSNTKIIFLLIKITLVLCNGSILTEVAEQKQYIEVFYKGCERLLNPSSKNCAIATLEWDFKCCYIQIGEDNKTCEYLKDNNKWIKNYKNALEESSGEKVTIKCESSFIKLCLFFILLFFIF